MGGSGAGAALAGEDTFAAEVCATSATGALATGTDILPDHFPSFNSRYYNSNNP